MTLQQALAFTVIGGAVVLFASGRLRYDLIALGALLTGVAGGVVRSADAFSGFTSDVVVIIASALVISAAIARSGVVELALRPLLERLKTPATQVPALAGATALLSMPTKNVGALAILMPVALQLARKTGVSPSYLLMPMAFMSLFGGLVTLVGTSTNIIVSQVRQETTGRAFGMFDFAPVGLILTALGLAYVSVAWRLLPKDRQGQSDLHEAVAGSVYSTDASLPDDWPAELATVADLKASSDSVVVAALITNKARRNKPRSNARLRPGDVLVLEGEPENIERLFARAPLVPARTDQPVSKTEASEEVRSIEAVVQPSSRLVGDTAEGLDLQKAHGVNLLAVGRFGEQIVDRLREVVLRAGDVLVLQAGERALPGALRELGVLPLAERDVPLGRVRRRFSPVVILTVAMVLVALKVTSVAVAFFGAAVIITATGALSMRQAYDLLDPQILVLIGALTPLSEAVRRTGGTELIASALAAGLHNLPPLFSVWALMVAGMACSPFLHNAPTVLVLGPIAAALAHRLHVSADSFLMAVATGAGCDFLTPVGHQCNTLVMGPGGYRFADYWRFGLPLSLLVAAIGPLLIAWVWPLASA